MSVYIIAEAGVNHNGSLSIAKELVNAAKDAGADCIKFQTFVANSIVTKRAKKAEYQKAIKEESQFEMLKKLELSFDEFIELSEYCKKREIEFMSTAFDFESIDFLKSLNMKKWKIPSGEITNLPYLIKIAKLKKTIILSTGMSTVEEIRTALDILNKNGAGEISILHCTTEYPVPYNEVNLNAMNMLKNLFERQVGYSDHTIGIEIPIAAVALGASVIEKHFTLSKKMEGPDHKASLEPHELKEMIKAIRNIELALGDGIKKPTKSELKNIDIARKSIVASKYIKTGEEFTINNLTVKRPGNGISPMEWFDILGSKAKKDFKEDEQIEI